MKRDWTLTWHNLFYGFFQCAWKLFYVKRTASEASDLKSIENFTSFSFLHILFFHIWSVSMVSSLLISVFSKSLKRICCIILNISILVIIIFASSFSVLSDSLLFEIFSKFCHSCNNQTTRTQFNFHFRGRKRSHTKYFQLFHWIECMREIKSIDYIICLVTTMRMLLLVLSLFRMIGCCVSIVVSFTLTLIQEFQSGM